MVDDTQVPQNAPEDEGSDADAESVIPDDIETEETEGAPEAPTPDLASLGHHATIGLRLLAVGILLCSVAYPAVISLVGHTLWGTSARGGIVKLDGEPVGAKLIGQQFTSDIYFHPRPSSKGYDAMDSGSQNLGPLNEALTERVEERLDDLEEQGIDPSRVPVGWVTESASSLDPHISPVAARLQIPRISRATDIPPDTLEKLIKTHTRGKLIGLFGQRRVNVLLLNLEVHKHLANAHE